MINVAEISRWSHAESNGSDTPATLAPTEEAYRLCTHLEGSCSKPTFPMLPAYSPRPDTGGVLHFPSPKHVHHVDQSSALRQLRRSLSKSPSKGPAFQLVSSKSASPSPRKSHSPLSLSPHVQRAATTPPFVLTVESSSHLAHPYPSSTKKHRPPLRRSSPSRVSAVATASHLGATKRALSDCTDHGNATPPSPLRLTSGSENQSSRDTSPDDDGRSLENRYGFDDTRHLDENWTTRQNTVRFDRSRWNTAPFIAKSSPLKRSDGIMNLDQASLGSPSAKRRSLHATTFDPDFSIFGSDIVDVDPANTEPVASAEWTDLEQSAGIPQMPKRISSLRKNTIHQRQEKPVFARTRPNADLSLEMGSGQPASKGRQRITWDQFLPPQNGEGVFTLQSALPSPSIHPMAQDRPENPMNDGHPQRHPLSRTITQSSSGSSVVDDSPTHIPFHPPESRKSAMEFSRSLPVGAAKPSQMKSVTAKFSRPPPSAEASTPENYKLAKPLPAAFMSTGLISKRHKFMTESQSEARGATANMPDTPCKRPTSMAAATPSVIPENASRKHANERKSIHSFGTPSTPFNPQRNRADSGAWESGVSIFGSNFFASGAGRRNVEDDNILSPSVKNRIFSPSALELPPTPTKPAQEQDVSESVARLTYDSELLGAEAATRNGPNGATDAQQTESNKGSSPIGIPFERPSPHTPKESILPPDPSGLSISVRADSQILHNTNDFVKRTSVVPPATPTAPRDQSSRFGDRRASTTPVHLNAPPEIDPHLLAKFDKAELAGAGEFAQVFRVAMNSTDNAETEISAQVVGSTPKTGARARNVWAVKRTRHPYVGQRDRKRKLQEVEVLRGLGFSDHTIHMVDHWELKNFLYIQTDFCDEGSLDAYLSNVGRSARLDDFRIWKTMLEITLGLKHIHDCGFIHLDLKPANILITFDGVLKIADFGLATSWPAEPGIDGEGDREYIGPEILLGQFDKPADVFALGLIMLEIAGNVMLPENGASWQRLRTGDMSDVPSLTWSSEDSNIARDSNGRPLSQYDLIEGSHGLDFANNSSGFADLAKQAGMDTQQMDPQLMLPRKGELLTPPDFMVEIGHEGSLDSVVRRMISPQPADRPVVDQLLGFSSVVWITKRRRAGATVYEGNYGPKDQLPAVDAEMIDV